MDHLFSVTKLKREMHYCPPWHKDKPLFFQLFKKSNFDENDILKLGRLYVKYSHMHNFNKTELAKYFNFMLKKTQIYSINNLINQTHSIYHKKT